MKAVLRLMHTDHPANPGLEYFSLPTCKWKLLADKSKEWQVLSGMLICGCAGQRSLLTVMHSFIHSKIFMAPLPNLCRHSWGHKHQSVTAGALGTRDALRKITTDDISIGQAGKTRHRRTWSQGSEWGLAERRVWGCLVREPQVQRLKGNLGQLKRGQQNCQIPKGSRTTSDY